MSKPRRRQSKPTRGQQGESAPDNQQTEQIEHTVDTLLDLSEEAAELVRRLETERDEAVAARMRALADYSNYQKRSIENEARATATGAAGVVRSILPVLDDLDLALTQDHSQLTVEQLAAGVKLVRDELFKGLESQGVSTIDPSPGAEFDPVRHEAMFHEAAEGFPANTVVTVLQLGYAMGELVLRPAKVTVASGDAAPRVCGEVIDDEHADDVDDDDKDVKVYNIDDDEGSFEFESKEDQE
ncbi:MAG: nucleotide exchange factor GrpE [Planctomycetota bacterium]|jgi:molecular chaperone GrpE